MNKGIVVLPLLLLAGCALTPEKATQLSDLDVCTKMIGGSTKTAQVAFQEASRRDLDCNDYVAIIAERKRHSNAAFMSGLLLLNSSQPKQQPIRQPINCTTRYHNGVGYTNCF